MTSAVDEGELSASHPGRITPGERAPVLVVVDRRSGLDAVEKRKFLPPPGLELQPLGHPVSYPVIIRNHGVGSKRVPVANHLSLGLEVIFLRTRWNTVTINEF
jgi:hypothetical protein